MKTRNGFISNSSSSSFIVDSDFDDEAEVVRIMELILYAYNAIFNGSLSTNVSTDQSDAPNVCGGVYKVYRFDVNNDSNLRYTIESEGIHGADEYQNRIVIESVDDNSIPYEIFSIIEYRFNARRYYGG